MTNMRRQKQSRHAGVPAPGFREGGCWVILNVIMALLGECAGGL